MVEIGCGFSVSQAPTPLTGELPEFAGFNDTAWKMALTGSQLAHYPAGSQLIRCDEQFDKLLIVLSGVIKVYETASNGREISLYRIHRGQVCMLSLTRMLHHAERCAQAVAEEDVRLLMIPREHFERLLSESRGFRQYLLGAMANCVSDLMKLTADISFNNLDLRLAQLICRLSERNNSIRLTLTHQAIANELGTTREVISRLLKDFERAGYIKLGRGRIQVLAMDRLARLCHQALKKAQLNV